MASNKPQVYKLVDGNYKVTSADEVYYLTEVEGSLVEHCYNSELETPSASQWVTWRSAIHAGIIAFDIDRMMKKNNYKKLEDIGNFSLWVSTTDYSLSIKIDDEMLPVTGELVENLKRSLSKAEKVKLEIATSKTKAKKVEFGNRVFMYWPTGTGKTYDFLQTAGELVKEWKLSPDNIEICTITDGLEDSDLFYHIIFWDPIKYQENRIVTLFRKAAAGEKVAILLDELNRWGKSLLNAVLKMLDAVDGKTYCLYYSPNNENIIVPIENVLFFATVNLGSKYVGTSVLDEALCDRFNIVQFKWYDAEVEASIAKTWFKTLDKKVLELVEFVRDVSRNWDVRSPISTRWLKMWAEAFVNTDWSIDSLVSSFNDTLMFRIVGVDDIGMPLSEHKIMVEKKINDLFIK